MPKETATTETPDDMYKEAFKMLVKAEKEGAAVILYTSEEEQKTADILLVQAGPIDAAELIACLGNNDPRVIELAVQRLEKEDN